MDIVPVMRKLAVYLPRINRHVDVLLPQNVEEARLEIGGVLFDEVLGVFGKKLHHLLVVFSVAVALESVGISALLLAHFAVVLLLVQDGLLQLVYLH